MSYDSARGIEAADVGEYLTNNVSRSIIFALLLSQPLTRDEIERSSVRASMRAIGYRSENEAKAPKEQSQLRTMLGKGVSSGVLLSYKSGGRNYYFLNSDLLISPEPIDREREDEKQVAIEVRNEPGVGEILGDVVLPPEAHAASTHTMPIPHIDSEKRLLLWLSWLITPVRREILRTVAQDGSIARPALRKSLGFWSDRLVMNEGIPSGILAIDGKNISFQFSSLEMTAEERESEGEERETIKWIENPPSFMLSRSYETLRCIHGSGAAIEELKKAKMSPIKALEELESAGRKIIPKNRRKALTTNFLEFASLFGSFDTLPRFPRGQSTLPLLLPDRIVANDMNAPVIWIKETRKSLPVSKTQFAVEASKIMIAKKAETEQIAALELLMKRIARERIQDYLDGIEKDISDIHHQKRATGFGLGKDSLSSYARLEMRREDLMNEKKYAEKFFNLIFGTDSGH